MSISSGKIETNLWQEQVWKPLEQTNANNLKRSKRCSRPTGRFWTSASRRSGPHIAAESGAPVAWRNSLTPAAGREMEAIAATYRVRVDLAEKLHTFEMDRAAKELDVSKQKVDRVRAEAELRKEMYDAGVDAELKLAELQKRRAGRTREDLHRALEHRAHEAGRLREATHRAPSTGRC